MRGRTIHLIDNALGKFTIYLFSVGTRGVRGMCWPSIINSRGKIGQRSWRRRASHWKLHMNGNEQQQQPSGVRKIEWQRPVIRLMICLFFVVDLRKGKDWVRETTAIFLNAHSGDRFAYNLAFSSFLLVLYWSWYGVRWRSMAVRLLTCATPIKKTFRNLRLYGGIFIKYSLFQQEEVSVSELAAFWKVVIMSGLLFWMGRLLPDEWMNHGPCELIKSMRGWSRRMKSSMPWNWNRDQSGLNGVFVHWIFFGWNLPLFSQTRTLSLPRLQIPSGVIIVINSTLLPFDLTIIGSLTTLVLIHEEQQLVCRDLLLKSDWRSRRSEIKLKARLSIIRRGFVVNRFVTARQFGRISI